MLPLRLVSWTLTVCVCPMVKRAAPQDDDDASPNKRQRTTRSEVIDLTMSSDESVAGPSRPRAASHALPNGSAQAAPHASTPEGYFASFYKSVTTMAKNLTEGFYGGASTHTPGHTQSPDQITCSGHQAQ